MSPINVCRIASLLIAGLATSTAAALPAAACGDFEPIRHAIVDMTYDGQLAYDNDGKRGASVSYSGQDGTLTYDRYDLGLSHITKQTVEEALRQSAFEIQGSVRMLGGEVVSVVAPEANSKIAGMALHQFAVVAIVSDDLFVSMVGMSTDGDCLHKVHYTPDLTGVDEAGIDGEGLFFVDRFHRALDGLAPYFGDRAR